MTQNLSSGHGATDQTCCGYFDFRNDLHEHPAMRALERKVLGCDFGGTSWTTREQADEIPAALDLAANSKLLEIGAGSGWPGLYLAEQTGCEVTLLDVPVKALHQAQRRAAGSRVAVKNQAVAASGAALPFRSGTFEAIGHSDVLCCLPEKLEMLLECRRVARRGAKMFFYVIAPAGGLSEQQLKEAVEVGPPFVGIEGGYSGMLGESGWSIIEQEELSRPYLRAVLRLVEGLEDGRRELETVMGEEDFNDHLLHRQQQADAIGRGLLVRESFLVQAE